MLHKSFYGTRDASANWQMEVTRHLTDLGFERGRAFPSVFRHQQKGLMTVVHGDDYVTSGGLGAARWLKRELERKFELKTTMVGPQEGLEKEVNILNRIIRVTQEGCGRGRPKAWRPLADGDGLGECKRDQDTRIP